MADKSQFCSACGCYISWSLSGVCPACGVVEHDFVPHLPGKTPNTKLGDHHEVSAMLNEVLYDEYVRLCMAYQDIGGNGMRRSREWTNGNSSSTP